MAHHANQNGRTQSAAPGPAGRTVHGPEIKVTLDPPNKVFFITADAQMPRIKAACQLPASSRAAAGGASAVSGPAVPPLAAVQSYEWNVTLVLNPAGVPYAVGRSTRHSPIHVTTAVPELTIPFTQIRGGTLTITVTTTFEGARVTGKAVAEILGTNPSVTLIRAEGASDLLMKLMKLESSLQLFLSSRAKAGYPVFSHDGLGGVGLGQITHPRPSDDEVWNWKANVSAAISQWESKRKNDAERLLRSYPKSKTFRALVDAYNKARTAPLTAAAKTLLEKAGKPLPTPLKPLTINLPPITEEMIDNETLRLYNGAPVVQEYVAETDTNGMLVVDVAQDNLHGTARWHEVSADERSALYVSHGMDANVGDPNYVNDVRSQVVN